MTPTLDLGPSALDVRARAGSEWPIQMVFSVDGVALDVSAGTFLAELHVRQRENADVALALTVDVTAAASGVIVLRATAAQTAGVAPGEYWWHLTIDDVTGIPADSEISGRFIVTDTWRNS